MIGSCLKPKRKPVERRPHARKVLRTLLYPAFSVNSNGCHRGKIGLPVRTVQIQEVLEFNFLKLQIKRLIANQKQPVATITLRGGNLWLLRADA